MAPRLTSHVRHRAKYLDMPVLEGQAFVFTDGGRAGPRARSLKEFMGLLAALPAAQIQAHLARHDFSRWIDDVFRDHGLGMQLRAIEDHASAEEARDLGARIAQAIRARYEAAAPITLAG